MKTTELFVEQTLTGHAVSARLPRVGMGPAQAPERWAGSANTRSGRRLGRGRPQRFHHLAAVDRSLVHAVFAGGSSIAQWGLTDDRPAGRAAVIP